MLREPVTIKPARPGHIWVTAAGSGACHTCMLKPGCGQYLLLAGKGTRSSLELADKHLPEQIKEQMKEPLQQEMSAELLLNGADLVKFSLLLYMLPLLALLAAVFAATVLVLPEGLAVTGVFTAFGLSLYILHKYIKRQDLRNSVRLRIKTETA